MPGRKKSKVEGLFKDVLNPSGKCKKVKCKFCSSELMKNGTRMVNHIANCKKCDDSIKHKYLNTKSKNENNDTDCVFSESDSDISELSNNSSLLEKCKKGQTSSTPAKKSCNTIETYFGAGKTIQSTSGETGTEISKGKSNKSIFSPQNSKINAFVDRMSDSQIAQTRLHLARAIYASGCPLNLVENKYWIRFFASLRPSFKMPNRDMISNSLLENIYQETATNAKEFVASAANVAILSDGWSNIRNEGIINIVVTVPKPIFWKSVETGSESHTGEYMANVMKEVIEEVGPMKVLGVCTDNAANMKKAWQLIQDEFKHIQAYGCLAHTLHLIFTDANKIKTAENVESDCTNVVKHIKKSQKLSAILKKHQHEQQQQLSLKLPVKTRWGSVIHCIESIQSNKHALQGLAIDEQANQSCLDSSIKKILLSEPFWDKIGGFLKLLKPVANAIKLVEGDDQHLSVVMKVFHDLEKSIAENLQSSPILKSEEERLLAILPKRKSFVAKPVHYAANLLDPRYRGCHLTADEADDALEVIYQIAQTVPGIDQDKILAEVADFRLKENRFRRPIIWAGAEKMSPTSWWNGICCDTELSKVASGILNLPPTSASVERSFSRHANIHSAKRNRLTNERAAAAAKLVYIAHNLALVSEDDDVQVQPRKQPSTSKEQHEEPPLSPSGSIDHNNDDDEFSGWSDESGSENVFIQSNSEFD